MAANTMILRQYISTCFMVFKHWVYKGLMLYFHIARGHHIPLSFILSATVYIICCIIFSLENWGGLRIIGLILGILSLMVDVFLVSTTLHLLLREQGFLRDKLSLSALLDLYFSIPVDAATFFVCLELYCPGEFTPMPLQGSWWQRVIRWLFFTVMLINGVGFGRIVAVGYVSQVGCTIAIATFQVFNLFALGIGMGIAIDNNVRAATAALEFELDDELGNGNFVFRRAVGELEDEELEDEEGEQTISPENEVSEVKQQDMLYFGSPKMCGSPCATKKDNVLNEVRTVLEEEPRRDVLDDLLCETVELDNDRIPVSSRSEEMSDRPFLSALNARERRMNARESFRRKIIGTQTTGPESTSVGIPPTIPSPGGTPPPGAPPPAARAFPRARNNPRFNPRRSRIRIRPTITEERNGERPKNGFF